MLSLSPKPRMDKILKDSKHLLADNKAMQRMIVSSNRSQGAELPELNHAFSNPEMYTQGQPNNLNSVTRHKISMVS